MRSVICILLSAFCLISCDRRCDCQEDLVRYEWNSTHLIDWYFSFGGFKKDVGERNQVRLELIPNEIYPSQELFNEINRWKGKEGYPNSFKTPQNVEIFNEIAERNEDIGFSNYYPYEIDQHKWTSTEFGYIIGSSNGALNKNITHIEITCDCDINDYPAGSSLRDISEVKLKSYSADLKGEDSGEEYLNVTKLASELTADDLRVIGRHLWVTIKETPKDKPYAYTNANVTITLTDEDNEKYVYKGEIIF